jgi:hypothetical protein
MKLFRARISLFWKLTLRLCLNFKATVRIWKFKMPVESRDAFEKQVFHPGSANEDLQRHLGMTMTQRLFDMNYSLLFAKYLHI